jgi:hypothetical protein
MKILLKYSLFALNSFKTLEVNFTFQHFLKNIININFSSLKIHSYNFKPHEIEFSCIFFITKTEFNMKITFKLVQTEFSFLLANFSLIIYRINFHKQLFNTQKNFGFNFSFFWLIFFLNFFTSTCSAH